MDKERKINILCFIILTGFVLAIIIHYVAGFYLGYGYPYNTFLLGRGIDGPILSILLLLVPTHIRLLAPNLYIFPFFIR